MLTRRQILILLVVGLLLWVGATATIRFYPQGFTRSAAGDLSFAITPFFAWLSVEAIRRSARLSRDQLLAGVALVGGIAMMIDGAALRWAAQLYGSDPHGLHRGAAWLLWGYGISLAAALLMVRRRPSA